MFVASLLINIGMWFERFVIVVTSLNRDYLPSSWDYYVPTRYDWGITLGSFGFFFTFFLLFCRILPAIAMSKAMGLKRSWIPYATLVFGLSGAGLLFYFQVWTMAIDWPINIGGKPFFSW